MSVSQREFFSACGCGMSAMTKVCIDHGAIEGLDADLINRGFLYACQNRRADVIAVLLSCGADVNYSDQSETGLHNICICRYGIIDCVRLLLKHGADPNVQDQHGETPLLRIVRNYWQNGNSELMQTAALLISAGADPTIPAIDGSTAIELSKRDAGMFKVLRNFTGGGAATKSAIVATEAKK